MPLSQCMLDIARCLICSHLSYLSQRFCHFFHKGLAHLVCLGIYRFIVIVKQGYFILRDGIQKCHQCLYISLLSSNFTELHNSLYFPLDILWKQPHGPHVISVCVFPITVMLLISSSYLIALVMTLVYLNISSNIFSICFRQVIFIHLKTLSFIHSLLKLFLIL